MVKAFLNQFLNPTASLLCRGESRLLTSTSCNNNTHVQVLPGIFNTTMSYRRDTSRPYSECSMDTSDVTTPPNELLQQVTPASQWRKSLPRRIYIEETLIASPAPVIESTHL